jgi:hypothetical protein
MIDRWGCAGRPLSRVAILGLTVMLCAAQGSLDAAEEHAFRVSGTFVEGCSCQAPCPCEMVGVEMGCEGVGVMSLRSGQYNGRSLEGVKIAYAVSPAKWVRLYIDAPTAQKRETAEKFARAVYAAWGPVESVKDAKISLEGAKGRYTAAVKLAEDGPSIMDLTTEPVLGADEENAIAHTNINNPLNRTLYQGKTRSLRFDDGGRSFTLQGTNSFFNHQMRSRGRI